METSALAEPFRTFTVKLIQRSEATVLQCLDRLTEQQIFERGGDYENSIANLLMHLEGNMRQWILHGIDGQPDTRMRDEEFALRPAPSAASIRAGFLSTLEECCGVITNLPDDRLLTIIDPQPGAGWEPTSIVEALMRIVGHLQLHTGQIILLTKQTTRSDLDLSLPRKR